MWTAPGLTLMKTNCFSFRLYLIVVLVIGLTGAYGADIVGAKKEFLITKWTTEAGLPQNTVTSIVQTSDGYIWVGTFGGLARFDGVKFTIFDSTNGPGLKSNRILALYEDRWKRLWVGTESGEVYTLIDKRFVEWNPDPTFVRVTVWQFMEDGIGNFFIASDSGLERLTFGNDGAIIPESTRILTRQKAYKLARGPGNTIWTSFGKAFVVDNDEVVDAQSKGIDLIRNIDTINFSDKGKMIVGTVSSLGWVEGGKFKEIKPPKKGINFNNSATAFKDEALWVQTGSDLLQITAEGTIVYDLSGYVDGSREVFIDKKDNIWLATQTDGLVRLKRRKIRLLSDMTDMEIRGQVVVAEDTSGSVWIGGEDLLRVHDGRVDSFAARNRLGGAQAITSLAIDAGGTVWAGSLSGLFYVASDRLQRFPQFPNTNVNSLYLDRNGTLWAGTPKGAWKINGGEAEQFTVKSGLAGDDVRFVTQTRDGTIWIGTTSGLSRFADGKFENITTANGLSNNYVREIVEDDDGTLWIGTYGGGIDRLRGGTIRAVTKANGLHDNFVSRMLADDEGKFWVLGNLGISAVRKDDLNAVADGTMTFLAGSVYGRTDGMPTDEGNGGHQPAGMRARDGRLWFPMIKDMVIIDPRDTDRVPPRVIIENAFAGTDDRSATLPSEIGSVSVGAGGRDIEIQFTGLEFSNPDKLRFFYKLEGHDTDWIDSQGQRKVVYPFLPSGQYTFLVKAISSDGVWSENPARLSIEVAKNFWQTWWFVTLFVSVLVMLVLLVYGFRLRRAEELQRNQEEFSRRLINAHEGERRRIASELHDGLGQNLLVIKNWAFLGQSQDISGMKEQLRLISETASAAIEETREIVGNLTPQNLKRFGLTEAVRNLSEKIQSSTGILLDKKIDNIDGLFSEEAEISVYRIIQESLSNIVRHSESPRASLIVDRLPSVIRIRIKDHGIGFDVASKNRSGSGFGLRTISERVRFLDGQIDLTSTPGSGTTVDIEVKIPGRAS